MKKEDKTYLVKKTLKFILISLIVIYLCLFFVNKTGYYTFSLRKQKELTDEQIKKFEEDVKNGVEIDLEDYLVTNDIDYQNNASKIGLTISNGISSIVRTGVNEIFGFLNDLIETEE